MSEAIRAEGWKWIDVAPDFPYGHSYGLRQLRGEQPPLTDEEQTTRDTLRAEMDDLEEAYAEADELPEEVDQQLGEIETALGQPDDRAQVFDPEADDGIKPILDRLMTELTAHRTLALRHALGENPHVAFVAALHALCLSRHP